MTSSPSSEAHFVAALQRHQRADLDLLYDAFAPPLYGLLLRLVKDNDLAQVVLQEAFGQIWSTSHLHNAQQSRLLPWMISITQKLVQEQRSIKPVSPVSQAFSPVAISNLFQSDSVEKQLNRPLVS